MTQKTALIVVDVQNDFVEGGALGAMGGRDLAIKLAQYIKTEPTDVIVTTQDWHQDVNTAHIEKWGRHCMVGTEGAELVDCVQSSINEVQVFLPYFPVKKGMKDSGYSGFSDAFFPSHSGLTEWLRRHGVTHISVVGIATEHCVQATAIDGIRAGFEVTVAKDMTVGLDEDDVKSAYEEMSRVGVKIIEHTE